MIRTDSAAQRDHGYQCVWNAAGIQDNIINPGGVNTLFWKIGETSASLYRERGAQICRPWPLADRNEITYTFKPYPRLPLQNTVSFDGSNYGRRVLINTTAHAVSYDFPGTTVGLDSNELPSHTRPVKPDNFIDMGRQFLRLTLQGAPQTDVVVHIPTDRQELLNAAGVRWWKVSMWMQDLTKSNDDESIVNVTVTQTRTPDAFSKHVDSEDSHVFPDTVTLNGFTNTMNTKVAATPFPGISQLFLIIMMS